MAYSYVFTIVLPANQTGLTLKAQMYDTSEAEVGGEITTGFTEMGGGTYVLATAVSDLFQGWIKFYTGTLPSGFRAAVAVNPADAELIEDINTKTSALPSDPADASDIAASFVTVNGKLDTIDDFLDTEIAAIKAKTDNLPADPADASDIAASFVTVNGKLDTIDDFLDTEVAAIKAKTDNLPSDPADASDIAAAFATVIAAIPSAANIADAVLDEDMTGHQTQGTLGQAIGDPEVDSSTIWGLVNTNLDTNVGSRASQASVTSVASDVSAIGVIVAAILDDTGTTGVVVAAASKTGYALSATGLNLVMIDGKTLPEATQYIAAACCGRVSGAGTGTEVFKGLDESTTRLTVTVDSSGNRTDLVYG